MACCFISDSRNSRTRRRFRQESDVSTLAATETPLGTSCPRDDTRHPAAFWFDAGIRILAAIWGLGLLSLGVSSLQAAQYTARFEHSQYLITPGETFPVRVVISPVPEAGLFSFGVRISYPGDAAEVEGVGSIQPNPDLATDGPHSGAPVVCVGSGFAVAKGCANLFDATRPVSTNSVLATFFLRDRDAGTGSYRLSLTNFNTLGLTEQIFVDGAGRVLDADLQFGEAEVIYGDGVLEAKTNSPVTLNRQSGLFEQVVRVTNGQGSAVGGFRLFVANLPPTWVVWNAHGQTNGLPYLDHAPVLMPGRSVDLRVEFRIPDRNPGHQPEYPVEPGSPTSPTTPEGDSFGVIPRGRLPDGAFLLEFDSLPSRTYAVQYSYDLTHWTTALPPLLGNGSRLQWIDAGPPKSDRPLDATPERYYRIFLLP